MMAILEASGITKTIDSGTHRVEILRGVDLEVPAGQFIAIMGASGSGAGDQARRDPSGVMEGPGCSMPSGSMFMSTLASDFGMTCSRLRGSHP